MDGRDVIHGDGCELDGRVRKRRKLTSWDREKWESVVLGWNYHWTISSRRRNGTQNPTWQVGVNAFVCIYV